MIKLQSFTIRNYRSIKELTFQLDRIAAFVGYNNAGKTNCLRAISMALSFEKPSLNFAQGYLQKKKLVFTGNKGQNLPDFGLYY